jgi:uncharacterized protein with PQ loop repeat
MGQVLYYRTWYRRGPIEEVVVNDYDHSSASDLVIHKQANNEDESSPLLLTKSHSKQDPNTRTIIRLFFISSILLWVGLLVGSALFFFWPGQSKVDTSQWHLIPQLLGWGSAILYCASRIPQIMQNFRNESVEGLSLIMFVFSVVGNLTYCVVSKIHYCYICYLIYGIYLEYRFGIN